MSDVFVSYSRRDREVVAWLAGALAEQGRDVWVDLDDIAPSAEWRTEIDEAIGAAGGFLFVVSPDSAESVVCGQELSRAVELHKRIVPVLVRELDGRHAPDAVASLNWVSCVDASERVAALAKVGAALDTDLAWVKTHTRLLVRASEWDGHDGDRSLLLRGDDLADAESALAVHHDDPPAPTEQQRRYVLASRRQATRRLRSGIAVALVAAVVIATLGVVAVIQSHTATENARRATENAEQALSRQLAANSTDALDSDPQLALVLALRAYDAQPTVQAGGAVRQAVVANRELHHFRGDGVVNAVRYTPDGDHLAVLSGGTVRVRDLRRAHEPPLALPTAGVLSIAFSPDGTTLATGGEDHVVRLWDWRHPDAAPEALEGHTDVVRAVAFSPDGTALAAAGDDHTVRVWDRRHPGTAATVLPPLPQGVDEVRFAPDGVHLVTAAYADPLLRVWDLGDLGAGPRTLPPHRLGVEAVAISADGRHLATAASAPDEGSVRIWDLDDLAAAPVVLPGVDPVIAVAFSPDGTRVATGGDDRTARVWDWQHPDTEPTVLSGDAGAVFDLEFAPDGSQLATAGRDQTARVWDLHPATADPLVLVHPFDQVSGVAFDADGSHLVTDSTDAIARVWDVRDPGAPPVRIPHSGVVNDIALSPDGTHVATASNLSIGATKEARVYDVRDPRAPPVTLSDPAVTVRGVAFSADGNWLVTTDAGGTIRRWRWRTPEDEPVVVRRVDLARGGVALSPDGRRLATTEGNTARVRDLRHPGARPVVLHHGAHATPGLTIGFVFAPDGRHVATRGDGDVLVWDLRRPAADPVALPLPGETGAVTFSPDGTLLATSSERAVQVWDWRNPSAEPAVFTGHTASVSGIAFTPDGTRFATTAADHTARVWDCGIVCEPFPKVLASARREVARTLTTAERRRYLSD